MSFGTEQPTPVGGQTLTGFIVSKAMQSRKDAKKEDKKAKRRKKKDTEDTSQTSEKKQGLKSKLLGSFAGLPNLFAGKKPEAENKPKQTRSSGGGTGLAKILSSGFGSLTADTMGLASALGSITQLLNNSLKAQSFTATGVQTISAILSDQLENQSSILSTVKTLKPGGGSGGGGKSMFGSAKSAGVGGDTLTGYLVDKFDLGGKISQFAGKGLNSIKNLFTGNKPITPKTQYTKPIGPQPVNSATPWAKGAAGEAANAAGHVPRLPSAPIAKAEGPLAKFGGMLTNAKGAVGGAFKGIQNKVSAVVAEKVGAKLATKGGLAAARAIPIAQQVLGIGLATKEIMDGDFVGAGLALGSALPGPFGWGFLAADIGREIAGPEMVDKSFSQAIGGNLGLSDQQIQKREKTMSATERALTTPSTPFFMGSSGGITSLSLGGVNAMVGEAAGGGGGEVVKDLRSAAGRKMMSNGGSTKEDPGVKTSGATTLAITDSFIKGLPPDVKPAVVQSLGPDIQNLSRDFGMSQALPNLRIGGGKFKEDGNAKRDREKFMEGLIGKSLEALEAKKKGDEKQKPPSTSPPPTTDANQQRLEQVQEQSKSMLGSIPGAGGVITRQAPEGVSVGTGEQAFATQNNVPGVQVKTASDDRMTVPAAGLNPVVGTSQQYWYDSNGNIYKWSPGKQVIGLFRNEIFKGLQPGDDFVRNTQTGIVTKISGQIKDGNPFNNTQIPIGNYSYRANDILVKRVKERESFADQNFAQDKLLWQRRDNEILKRGGVNVNSDIGGMYGPSTTTINHSSLQRGQFESGGDLSKIFTQPLPATPSRMSSAATNQSGLNTNSITMINIMGSSGGGSTNIPTSSDSPQDSSRYIQDCFPSGLAGVLCTSPWSVV